MRMSYWISDVCSSDLVRGAVRFGRSLVVIAFEHLVYARFARPEQAVIAVAGFARAHRRGELGENAFEFLFLARLHAQRRDDADGAHIALPHYDWRPGRHAPARLALSEDFEQARGALTAADAHGDDGIFDDAALAVDQRRADE